MTAFGPALVAGAAREAPRVVLRFLGETHVDLPILREGAADLELGVIDSTEPEIRIEELYTDRGTAGVRAGHPLTQGTVTARRFAGAPHINYSRRGRLTGPIDTALAELGLRRRVMTVVPTFVAMMTMVLQTDAVGVAPERTGAAVLARLGVRTFPIPLDLPAMPVGMAWHPRHDADAGHVWLRGFVRRVVAETVGPDSAAPASVAARAAAPASGAQETGASASVSDPAPTERP
ncbi:LysR substrate-binding domain-containing protein [Streptomyces sp. MST-110588]|uniref:LysR substrate-binding domain-containing protein n=1 Tax=Streptomyces sp. MST-110588 TaxID=2833628 RepID=UPI003241FB95